MIERVGMVAVYALGIVFGLIGSVLAWTVGGDAFWTFATYFIVSFGWMSAVSFLRFLSSRASNAAYARRLERLSASET